MRKIYLDYMATTPVDPRVVQKMKDYLDIEGCFGNPASNTHDCGLDARAAVEQARADVAALINAKPHEIIWTSGATESDNLALKGAYEFYKQQGKHIVTVTTEHKAVLDTAQYLDETGADVTFLEPREDGLLDLQQIEEALRDDTILVSIMHVNNEIGVIQDIEAIGNLLRGRGILFHVDAAQSAGKEPIDVEAMHIDLLSLSGHKIYGPKGIGALYVRSKPRVRLKPLIHGGGHELGMRSGTLATHQIVGMGEAFVIAANEQTADHDRIEQLAARVTDCLAAIAGVHFNGDRTQRYPGNINFRVEGVQGESLMLALAPLEVSASSACSSSSRQPSYVLKALGLSDQAALGSVRLSLGRFTTEADVNFICEHLKTQILRLQQLSPRGKAA